MGTTNKDIVDEAGRQDTGIRDVPEVRPPANGGDARLEPGRAVPATPEDAAAIRLIMEEVERNPEKYADFAWEEVPEGT